MSRTNIERLSEFGQSIWLDNISRSLIETGRIKELIDLGLRGMTSNPTIFEKSISSSADYDEQITGLLQQERSTFEIYDELTVKDIQDAADIFRPVFDKTNGLDGYVSLEVNPKLAYKTEETIEEGKRLWKKVGRPNLMLKVPSTKEGFKAVEELTASGMNVNVTLIFSLEQYMDATKAYINGMKRVLYNGKDASGVRSVASVFISRVDTVVDKFLDDKKEALHLKGKAAAANTQLIYAKYREVFTSDEFKSLEKKGVNAQRALWGSTSTKNPEYSDIKYVTELIGKDSVNTVPPNTFDAFLDHGIVKEALTGQTDEAGKIITQLKDVGIDVNAVCDELLKAGVKAFEKSFDSLLCSIAEKTKELSKV
jgi:transaldolase